MQVRSAHDLPDFRLWLIDQWRPGAEFDRLESLWPWTGIAPPPEPTPPGFVEGAIQRNALSHAALWWVTDEMTTLVERAALTLPETTLTRDLLPDEDGLVVFAHPLIGHQSDDGEPIHTDALVWSTGESRSLPRKPMLSIISYHFQRAGSRVGNTVVGYVNLPSDQWSPTGTATWDFDTDTEEVLAEQTPASVLSVTEDRRWLAALWLLASQPLAESVVGPAPRAARRRSDRARLPSDVRIVNLRRAATPREPSPGTEHGTHRKYSHRFIVDGFWRQQACGPNWSQHRPVWIAPFIKGPKDKPLKVRETVKVLKE